jgi:hypothetical protein
MYEVSATTSYATHGTAFCSSGPDVVCLYFFDPSPTIPLYQCGSVPRSLWSAHTSRQDSRHNWDTEIANFSFVFSVKKIKVVNFEL